MRSGTTLGARRIRETWEVPGRALRPKLNDPADELLRVTRNDQAALLVPPVKPAAVVGRDASTASSIRCRSENRNGFSRRAGGRSAGAWSVLNSRPVSVIVGTPSSAQCLLKISP